MPTRTSSARALSISSGLRAPASSSRTFVRRTATSMFSRTVMRGNTRQSWKLRPIPARAILCGARRVMSSPRNVTVPESGLIMPVTQLKNVVLPEPLGPMSALILRGGT